MRLKNLLTFLVLLSVSLGMRAGVNAVVSDDGKTLTLTWDGNYDSSCSDYITSNLAAINEAGYEKLVINGLTNEFSPINNVNIPYIHIGEGTGLQGERQLTNPNIKGIFCSVNNQPKVTLDRFSGTDVVVINTTDNGYEATAVCTNDNTIKNANDAFGVNLYSLTVSGTVGATDAANLNATNVNLSAATVTVSDINSTAQYLRLPNSMTTEDDLNAMKNLKEGGKNSNLKVVGAYDPDNEEYDDSSKKWGEVTIHSFEANNVPQFLAGVNIPISGNLQGKTIPRKIRLSGEFGDKDLVNDGTPNFGEGNGVGAEWDFTGAHFADCTIADATQNASYYSYDDPFCDGELVKCPTTTNAFYYFTKYCTNAVDLKLPDTNMTHLPFQCLSKLASDNAAGYKALYGEDAFEDNKESDKIVPMETLRIPDCYTDLDEECGKWACIRHLYVGSGMKRIHGGAFLKCDYLEDLDFAAGLSDCYIGDRAFNECKSMKHIALSEGIVSLGNGCFWNSQHLESIRLPQSLLYMGNHCFDNCLALNSITIPENVEKIGKAAFNLCI